MSKFSVKKPLTVFVAVIAILVLGVVAYFRMTPDLLPNMDFPYVLIMTTYPGASPEKVEQEITKPMEQAMSTLDHIQEVTSVSSENVGMVILEFTEGVNMDTVGVDIQQEISQLSADWSDTVGTPYVLKINPSMLPVEVAAVSMEGMDTVELTEFLDKLHWVGWFIPPGLVCGFLPNRRMDVLRHAGFLRCLTFFCPLLFLDKWVVSLPIGVQGASGAGA